MASVELWWLGQAGFRLRDPETGVTVFVDPFLAVREDRTWQAPATPTDLANADVVLVSHEHIDHFDKATIELAGTLPSSRFTLVLPKPIVEQVVNLRAERLVGAQPGDALDLGGVGVWPVPARHGVNVSDAYNFGETLSNGQVRYLGYVIDIGGVRVYHAGDCVPYAGQAERIRALGARIGLLPINGRDFFRETERNIVGNMDYREAARLADEIGVDLLVPMHWELFASNRGYPFELVRYCEEHYPTLSVLVLGRGARFTFTLSA